MAYHDVRLSRYEDYNPGTAKWRDDKRNYERATGVLKVTIAKNYSTLGIPGAAIYPEIEKGKFVGCKIAASDGVMKNYFEREEVKTLFFGLLQDAFIEALDKKEKKRDGEDVKASTSESKLIGFSEPPRPVWILNLRELETYFSDLKTQLAANDDIKIRRKWPKIENGVATKLPTKVPALDEIAEKILPSDKFIPGQPFAPGNKQWRLKLVCAYFMISNGKDPNKFATKIPDDYVRTELSLEQLKTLSDDVNASIADALQGQNKKGSGARNEQEGPPLWNLELLDENIDIEKVPNETMVGEIVTTTETIIEVIAPVSRVQVQPPYDASRTQPRSDVSRTQPPSASRTQHPSASRTQHPSASRTCLLYTSPSPRDGLLSRMPSSA